MVYPQPIRQLLHRVLIHASLCKYRRSHLLRCRLLLCLRILFFSSRVGVVLSPGRLLLPRGLLRQGPGVLLLGRGLGALRLERRPGVRLLSGCGRSLGGAWDLLSLKLSPCILDLYYLLVNWWRLRHPYHVPCLRLAPLIYLDLEGHLVSQGHALGLLLVQEDVTLVTLQSSLTEDEAKTLVRIVTLHRPFVSLRKARGDCGLGRYSGRAALQWCPKSSSCGSSPACPRNLGR
mmetsp:Transcript_94680/g.276875  ORF Transcript_94680/g.276875 Transcript_94680/m.276875 type:complete len:233 (-) Transcript_94680:221-919(-)